MFLTNYAEHSSKVFLHRSIKHSPILYGNQQKHHLVSLAVGSHCGSSLLQDMGLGIRTLAL